MSGDRSWEDLRIDVTQGIPKGDRGKKNMSKEGFLCDGL